ncbi:MAG: hypothetical protein ACK5KR_02080 [Breznakia sp.]
MHKREKLLENITLLKLMTTNDWGTYAFSRDPIRGKIKGAEQKNYIAKAMHCGVDLAIKIKKKYNGKNFWEMLNLLEIKVIKEKTSGTQNYITFAKYNYPNKITVYTENVVRFNNFIDEHGLRVILEDVNIEEVLLAHEMYHYFEEHNENLYSKREKIVLWKIGKFKYKSSIIALSEISAMAFTQEMLGLTYSPYIFDSLLLLPHDFEKAEKLINEVLEFRMGGRK